MEPEDVTDEMLGRWYHGGLGGLDDTATGAIVAKAVNAVFGEDAKPVVLTEEERKMLLQFKNIQQENCTLYREMSEDLSDAGWERWEKSKNFYQMLSRILSATKPEERNE